MPTINGSEDADFIHSVGDGLVAPPGYNDVTGTTEGNDAINGGAGDDIIYGGGGVDSIFGGLGTDQLHGGAGRDSFTINNNAEIDGLHEIIDGDADSAIINFITSGGSIDLSNASISNVDALYMRSTSSSSLTLTMTAETINSLSVIVSANSNLNNTIFIQGGGAVNLEDVTLNGLYALSGSEAADHLSLSGRIESTHVFGMGGDDFIDLDSSSDNTLKKAPYTLDGGDGNDVLVAHTGLNTLIGGKGADELNGGKLDDTLDGGKGRDVLKGGGHKDILSGGGDADRFVYVKLADSKVEAKGRDMITDFSHGQGDLIDLTKLDADTTAAGDQAFHLGGAVFTSMAGELIQTLSGGHIILSGDVNGDAVADFSIEIGAATALVESDFWF